MYEERRPIYRRRKTWIFVAMVVLGVAAVPASRPLYDLNAPSGPQPDGSLDRARPVSTTAGAYFGAYVKPRKGQMTERRVKKAVRNVESYLGRKLDIDHHYYCFGCSFPGWAEKWDLSKGRIPLISWSMYYPNKINAGAYDRLIRKRAEAIKALGKPVFLRWGFEMDSVYLDKKYNVTPTNFISAWKHIRTIFRRRGAKNVRWVWCPNAYGFEIHKAAAFYPGNRWVDWICADGYNWAPAYSWADWQSFRRVFRDWYAWAKKRPKPLMVAETGCLERHPGDKAQWITQARRAIKERMRKIHAFVYFHAKETDYNGNWFNWRADTSRSAYRALKRMARDPYFHPRHSRFL